MGNRDYMARAEANRRIFNSNFKTASEVNREKREREEEERRLNAITPQTAQTSAERYAQNTADRWSTANFNQTKTVMPPVTSTSKLTETIGTTPSNKSAETYRDTRYGKVTTERPVQASMPNPKRAIKQTSDANKRLNTSITQRRYDELDPEAKELLQIVYDNTDMGDTEGMTRRKNAVDTLKTKYGISERDAQIYKNLANREHTQEATESLMNEVKEYSKEHPWISSAASVPANMVGGFLTAQGAAKDISDALEMRGAGYKGELTINPNNPNYALTRGAQAARDTFMENHDLMVGDFDAGDFLYGTAMSGLDSLSAMLIPQPFGGAAIGLTAAADKLLDKADKGTPIGRTLISAILSGTFEGLFESYSMAKMKKFAKLDEMSIKTVKDLVKKVAGSMLTNAEEEGATEIANIIADIVVNGGASDYAQSVQTYMANGMSEKDAKSQAIKDLVLQVGEAAAGGGLMGAGFGIGGGAFNAVGTAIRGNTVGGAVSSYSGGTEQVLDTAKAVGGSAEKYAESVLKKRGGAGNLTDTEIGKVAIATGEELEDATEETKENVKKVEEQYKETRNEALDRALEKVKSSGITDEGVRNSFHDSYSGGDMETYARNFANAAQLASTGLSEREYINKLESLEMLDGMGAHAIQAAYASGLNSTVSKSGAHMFATMNAVRSKEKRRAISSMVSLVDEFGKQRGLSFTFVDTINDKNGFYRNKTGSNQIVISLDAEGTEATDIKGIKPERNIPAILRTVAHETFHWLEQYDKDNDATLSSELKDFIVGYYENVKGKEWLNDTLEKNYPSSTYKTEEARISEFVADNLFSAFASDRAVNELVSKNENLAKRVKRHIGEAITFFRNAIKKMEAKGIYQEISEMQKNLEMLDEINNRFFDALNKATGREARSEQKELGTILTNEKARQAEKLNEALKKRQGEMEETERQEAERKAEEERKAKEEAERKAKEEKEAKKEKREFTKWRDEFVNEIDNELGLTYDNVAQKVNHEIREEIETLMDRHNEMQFAYRFAVNKNNSEMTAEIQKDLKEFVNSFNDMKELRKYEFIVNQYALWQVGEHFGWGDYTTGSDIRGAVSKVSGYFTRRVKALSKQQESENAVGKDRSIRGVKNTAEIRKMFNEYNSNKELSVLAEKVFDVCEKLGVKYKGDRGYGEGTGGVATGLRVRYNNKYLSRTDVVDQEKANTLLHEAIHACTTYYVKGNITKSATGEYVFRSKDGAAYEISSDVAEAVSALRSIYDQVKGVAKSDNEFGLEAWNESKKTGDYGTKNLEEFVAELSNPQFTGKLKKVGLWEKIKDAIKGIFGIARSSKGAASKALDVLLDNYDVTLAKMNDYYSRGKYEGMNGAKSWTFSTQRNRLADNGIEITDDNTARFSSIRAFAKFDENGEFVIDKAKVMECAEDMSTATGIPYKKCLKYLKDNLSLTALVLQDREHLEYEADDFYSAFKSNSEYWWGAIDFNTNCPKRKSFTEIYDRLQQKWNKRSFDQWDLAIIRNVLQDSGIQVACGLCFVEDRRQQLGKIATDYISMVKASQKTGETLTKKNSSGKLTPLHVTEKLAEQWGDILGVKKGDDLVITDDYVPTQYDLGTYEGFRALRENHPQIAMGYIAYNNSRGQQSGRLIEGTAEYKRQILDLTQKQVDTINNNGGLRIFSFSDFEAPHTIDLIQIIEDCSARGIKIQAYTKQPAFARMVKDTNLKLNLSRIPSGIGYREVARGFKNAVEYNGKYYELTFDNVEGINKDVDNYIDTNKNDNIGNVLVGINETQIRLAMKSKMIDFIIPFHTNQRRAVLAVKGVSKKWVNYKNTQNEKVKSTGKNAKTNVNIYTDVIQKHGISNEAARAKGMTAERMFTEAFLQECSENGLTPRFAEFLDKGNIGGYGYTEGYYKFLVDYKLFNQNGEMLEQKVVVPKFDLGYVREMIEAQRDSSSAFEVEKPKRDAAVNEIDALIRSGAMNEGGALRKQVQEAAKNRKVDEIPSVRDMVSSTKREAEYAPTFYSQMGKVIDGVKQDKLSVNGLINMLKGKGVKDEEIQWSGIEEWLTDKGKSVTKEELQEFIQNSMLNIEQVTLSNDPQMHIVDTEDGGFDVVSETGESIHFFYSEEKDMFVSNESDEEFAFPQDALEFYSDPYGENLNTTKWHEYKTEGGQNYREVLFTISGSDYSNQAMQVHWDRTGVLAHARIQDMTDADGKRMLFIDEIQSDWHNAAEKKENGSPVGYVKKGERTRSKVTEELQSNYADFKNDETIKPLAERVANIYYATDVNMDRAYMWLMTASNREISQLKNDGVSISESESKAIKFYSEKQKELLKEQDTVLDRAAPPDAPFKNGKYVDYVLKNLLRMAAENGYDKLAWTPSEMQSERWSDKFAEGYRIEYDQDIPKFLNKFGKKFGAKVGQSYIVGYDVPVWSIDITPEMRDSVLYEGQPLYSTKRDQEYLDAIDKYGKDSKEVAEFVEQAAKEAGYAIKAYHGTNAKFTKFAKELFGKNYGAWSELGGGFYFAPTEKGANRWAEAAVSKKGGSTTIMPVFLSAKNMIGYDESLRNNQIAKDIVYGDKGLDQPEEYGDTDKNYWRNWILDRTTRFIEYLQNRNYTPQQISELFMSMGYDGIKDAIGDNGQYVVFNPEQIKSADPVTYDDQGNIIPLSERFNSENEDIRYSEKRDSEYMDADESGDGRNNIGNTIDDVREFYDKFEKPKFKEGASWTDKDDIQSAKYNADLLKYLFDKYNSDSELEQLSKLVFDKLFDLDVEDSSYLGSRRNTRAHFTTRENARKYWHALTINDFISIADENVKAYYNPERHSEASGIVYFTDELDKYDAQERAHIILHEAIHACTTRAIKLAERIYNQASKNAGHTLNLADFSIDSVEVSDEVKETARAGIMLMQIYESINGSRTGSDYGYKDVYEMVAEMSNREFREKLKKHSLMDKFIDAIKRILGIKPTNAYEGISIALEKILETGEGVARAAAVIDTENEDTRYSTRRDSDGNQLTTEQKNFFEKSKIRDENGNLLVVYHGTDEDFTVFDKTKGRSTMDIQGMFFSPWEIDAGGYGQNVGKYYLNITNPAPEGAAYKALNMYKGQNDAGVKAREYLEKLGYDGVNNGNEEYIAFNSNQIKRVDNLNPTENEDTRYSERRDIRYEAEQTLNNATEEEMKQIVDAVDRELLGDAMGYGRMLGEQKRKTEQKVREQRKKDVEYYHQRMREIRADRDQKLMALKMLQYQKEVERKEFSKRQDYKGRIIRKYEKLQKMLRHPTENQHVPEDLVYSIADFLEYITPNFLQEQYRKDGTTIKNREKNNNRLMDLVYAYGELKEEYEEIYDEEIYQLLDEASKAFGKKTIDEMDSYELSDINNLLGAIEHTIRRANKVFVENKERDAYALAHTLIDQSKEGKKTKSNHLKQVLWDQLNPYSVFHAMANYENGGWMDMYKILNEGQMKKTQIQVDVVDAFKDLMINKELDKLSDYKNGLVDVGLIGKNNQPVKITRGFMLSLYLHLLSEQNRNHIARGGLTIPNFERYYKGDKEAWGNEIVRTLSINPDLMALHREENRLRKLKSASNSKEIKKRYDADIADIQEQMKGLQEDADRFMDDIMVRIESQLTDYERKFIDKAKWFFNDYSKGVLNDATMKMYGFRKASEKNYMPIISDEDFLNAKFESIVRDASLENMGFMKNRVRGASNAIKLFDLTDVINSQLNKVSKFAGLAPAIKEFNNVYNKRFLYNGDDTSVQEAAKQRFGAYGKDYIEYLLADLQGGRKAKGSKKIFSKLRGNSYQAALMLNARVAMSQTASFPTSAAVVGWKPLAKALAKGGKDGKVISKADKELIAKYSPLLANRFVGSIKTDITNINKRNLHTLSGIENRALQKTRALTDWISLMDTVTVGRLWSAAEYYVDEHYNLERGSEEEIENGQSEYYKKVAEVFNTIVERTQPAYTTMQRPELLRNPNEALKFFTMFMTQRAQNFNIMYDSAGRLLREIERKKSGVYDATELKEAKLAFGRAASSQVVQAVTLAVFKGAVDLLMHSFKKYKDDDDDITFLSVLERVSLTAIESLVSNAFLGSELYTYIEKAITGETYYGITPNVIGTITDFSKAAINLIQNGFSEYNVMKVATSLSMILGIPGSQLKKWYEAFEGWIKDIQNGEFDS